MNKGVFNWSGANNLKLAFGDGVLEPVKELKDGIQSSCLCQLTDSVGKGYIELLAFNDAFSASIFNCTWDSMGEVVVDDEDRVRLNFSLELDIVMEFDESDGIDMKQPSWRLINNAKNHLTHETYTEGSRTTWVTIAFTPAYLERLFGENFLTSNEQLSELILAVEELSVYREYPLDHRLNQITSNMITSHLDEQLHLKYMESKANELLCIAINHILEDRPAAGIPVILKARDQQAIHLARELLLNNLSHAPNVREICLMVGMNRNKLHYGFKQMFGMPISKYLQEERLTEAYRQLEMTDQNILQIAMNVGFGHQSSFSTAFRRKYGFSPNKLRKDS